MSAESTDKIILIIETAPQNDAPRAYMGVYSCLGKGLTHIHRQCIEDEIKTLVLSGKEGKFEIQNGKFVVFIISGEIANLHTLEYPLVVFKGENVIDIDEWWYTPFKNLIYSDDTCDHYYSCDFKNWEESSERNGNIEYGRIIKFKLNKEDKDWIYAVKTTNITFRLS